MKRLSLVALVAALSVTPAVTPAVAHAQPAVAHAQPAVDPQVALDSYRTTAGGPGAALHTHSRTLHSGSASITENRPITPDDRFRAASQTKTFTAVAVLQLVDDGSVDLDATVERYLPGVVTGNGHDGTKITVRQVLQNTSGITSSTSDPQPQPDGTYTLRELVRAGLTTPPRTAPGTAFEYSNTNFALAGLLVEQVTGRSIGDVITARIIAPLGLTRTEYPRSRSMAAPFVPGYQGGRLGPFFFWLDRTDSVEPSFIASAGAIVSSQRDLSTFQRALLDGRLLSPSTLRQMRTTVPMPGVPADSRYGLGLWRLALTCGGEAWGHFGDLSTGHSSGTFATDDGRVAALVTNTIVLTEPATTRIQVIDAALCA
uniref:serine hydrolase domain-containing protein n=1 Tax=Saccharothrix mutabilis TaxID=33921 RepID=UPI0031D674D4